MAALVYDPNNNTVGIAVTVAGPNGGANMAAILPAFTLTDTAGNQGSMPSAGADGASNTATGQLNYSRNLVFNGTSWDRARGDATGSDVVLGTRATAGGATQFRRIATADVNAAVIKASAGRIFGYNLFNPSAAVKFVKLYNKATAPVVGTDTPIRTIMIPANGVVDYNLVGQGLAGFSSGIAMAATALAADTDTTALAAGDVIVQIDYA